jgi:hypothetical protein
MKNSKKAFTKVIEKRVRKYARLNRLFRKNDRILVKGSLEKYLVPRIIQDLPCRIYYQKPKNVRIDKIVVPWTLDDEINLFLKQYFTGKKTKQNPKQIKLLKPITDKEAARFAKAKKLSFKPNKKDREIQKFINKMTEHYSDTKYKLYKSTGLMKCIKKLSSQS